MTPTSKKFIALAVMILLCSTALIIVYVKWDKISGGSEVVEGGGSSSAAAATTGDGVALAEGGGQPKGPSPKMKQVLAKHHLFKANTSEFTKRIADLKANNPNDEHLCIICLCQEVDGSADMIETSCCSKSFYCVPCFKRYLKDNYTCPVCRKSLTS